MRATFSKYEVIVHNREKMDCSLRAGRQPLPQTHEFKYLWVLFTSDGRKEQEKMDGLEHYLQ